LLKFLWYTIDENNEDRSVCLSFCGTSMTALGLSCSQRVGGRRPSNSRGREAAFGSEAGCARGPETFPARSEASGVRRAVCPASGSGSLGVPAAGPSPCPRLCPSLGEAAAALRPSGLLRWLWGAACGELPAVPAPRHARLPRLSPSQLSRGCSTARLGPCRRLAMRGLGRSCETG